VTKTSQRALPNPTLNNNQPSRPLQFNPNPRVSTHKPQSDSPKPKPNRSTPRDIHTIHPPLAVTFWVCPYLPAARHSGRPPPPLHPSPSRDLSCDARESWGERSRHLGGRWRRGWRFRVVVGWADGRRSAGVDVDVDRCAGRGRGMVDLGLYSW
jgi:hypothetical protein